MSNIRAAELRWDGDLRFTAGLPGRGTTTIDAGGDTAPGPMVQLLMAAGACSGADVVSILQKMQVGLERCELTVTGVRQEEHPRRYLSVHYLFRLAGSGLDEVKARRAIDLSIEKYCSVLHSLRPDIAVSYDLELG